MNRLFAVPFAAALLSLTLLTGCGKSDNSQNQTTTVAGSDQSVSAAGSAGTGFDSLPADAPRINVQLVQQALSQVQQSDPQGWLQDFEKRVNEIYEGQGVVSIDARQDASNNLLITGYISQSGQQGYQPGDDQLFTITQTGPVVNNDAPYRMTYATYGGPYAYYDGYYHNPFLTAWVINSLVYGHPWGGYYTPYSRIAVITTYRTTYRSTPAFINQSAYTHTYYHDTYHGATVTVRPGAYAGTVRPSAAAAATPVHVTPPAAAPAVMPPAPASYKSVFNRSGAPAGAPAAHVPTNAVPAAKPSGYTPYVPKAGPGGLFSPNTFKSTTPRSFSHSSGGGRHH